MSDPDTQPTCSQALSHCLYFTANAVAREINRLAEEAFAASGLCPSGALLLSLVVEKPGIAPSEAADLLHLAPSSVTRFADGLVRRNLVHRVPDGRQKLLHPTPEGVSLIPTIQAAWGRLYEAYSQRVGPERGRELASELAQVANQLDRT